MQLTHIRRIPLYQIFLDLSKAYDTLDQTRKLQLQYFRIMAWAIKSCYDSPIFGILLQLLLNSKDTTETLFDRSAEQHRETSYHQQFSTLLSMQWCKHGTTRWKHKDFQTKFRLFSMLTMATYIARMRTNFNEQRNSWFLIYLNACWDSKPIPPKPMQWSLHHTHPLREYVHRQTYVDYWATTQKIPTACGSDVSLNATPAIPRYKPGTLRDTNKPNMELT
jgi:hypothetical protein